MHIGQNALCACGERVERTDGDAAYNALTGAC
jgi:hypothetical protein